MCMCGRSVTAYISVNWNHVANRIYHPNGGIKIRLAVYGKGGIGKSTVSSNLSYVLSRKGRRVMQVGCDPKHDSTMPLTGGVRQQTVLDYIKRVPPSRRKLEDVAEVGTNGIVCIEAGGPEPGIGCAGRGILTTFNTLRDLGIEDMDCDFTLYDVLGDVVCGGFAVPMRTENTDAVFIVTSGEFMAMYAANNIMRGLMNFDDTNPRLAGIILNSRGMEDERRRVQVLADAVGVPIVAEMPRSREFKLAEQKGCTVSELFPDSVPAEVFDGLADLILEIDRGEAPLYLPHPLTDEQLNLLMAGKVPGKGLFNSRNRCDKPAYIGMGSCASRGAVFEAGRIVDMPIIIHGPRSCGYVMSHTQDGHYLAEIARSPTAVPRLRNNIVCTDMRDRSSIFGGKADLVRRLEEQVAMGRDTMMVVTTCVSGMIGDDIDSIAREFMASHPGVTVLNVHADGNLTGESEEGRLQVLERFVSLIDETVEPADMAVNLVDDTFMWYNSGYNDKWVRSVLDRLGIGIGCKLFEDSTIEQIRGCRRNRLNILVEDTVPNRKVADMLRAKGMEVMPQVLPMGFTETAEWVRTLAGIVGKDPEPIVADIEREYRESIAGSSAYLKGKRVDFMVGVTANIDWMAEALMDAGAEIGKVHVLRMGPGSGSFYSRYTDELNIIMERDYDETMESIRSDYPDLLVSGAMNRRQVDCKMISYGRECVTHLAQVKWLQRVCNMMKAVPREEWLSWGDEE